MNSFTTKCLISVLACLAVGFGSGLSTGLSDMSWFDTLTKPSFNPPSWVFGPAWTILYIMMGVAVAYVWNEEESPERNSAIKFFLIQMVFNLIWTPMFFSLKRIDIALFIIVSLWILIIMTIIRFKKVNKTAAYLMIPYLLWVSFATILNATFLYLN